jgi:hypothetical protein
MVSGILIYVDLFSLLWAWLNQWSSILTEIYLKVLAHVEGSAVANEFWYITVFVGLLGILVTNVLGAQYFYRDNRPLEAALAACDLETPYLVATQGQDYAKGAAPDLQGLRRRNALWRGLPCAASGVFIAFRSVAQTSLCQYITQVQMLSDPELHKDIEQQFGRDANPPAWEVDEVTENAAVYLRKTFGENKCPAAHRQILPVTTLEEYRIMVGLCSASTDEVRQLRDLSALQVMCHEFYADLFARGISDSFPSLEPLGLSSETIEELIMHAEGGVSTRSWNKAGGDQAFVVTYSNPRSAWLLLQAAVQLFVAVRGLANNVRERRRLPLMPTLALYVHIFLEALLSIGCLVILFSVMPAENHLKSMGDVVLEEFHSQASGQILDRFARFVHILVFEEGYLPPITDVPPPSSQGIKYLDNEIIPEVMPSMLRVQMKWLDVVAELHTPDLAVEQRNFVKLIAIAILLYGIMLGVFGKVGAHVLVTSPAVFLDKDGAEPTSLVFQMAFKTAAVLSPYIIAAISWMEFKVVIATMFALLVRSKFAYIIALGVYVGMLISSGITAIVYLNQPDALSDGNGDDEELRTYPPQQGCCAFDRKGHKPSFSSLTTRATMMEAGAGRGLLDQLAPTYGAFADDRRFGMPKAG